MFHKRVDQFIAEVNTKGSIELLEHLIQEMPEKVFYMIRIKNEKIG